MKKVNIILVIFLLITAGCGGNKSGNQTDDLITVDVTASYPKKELILQDFMDVEYVPLETNKDFICQGRVQDIGKDLIIVRNNTQDGDIFIFNRSGKALKKINRMGKGGEEYTNILKITLDEDNREMFVNNYSTRKIIVYDLDGNFKRSFRHKEGTMYGEVYNFDSENLICHDARNENSVSITLVNKGQSFMIVSKQDGRIIKEIQIPFEEKKTAAMKYKDETSGMTYVNAPSTLHSLVPYFNDWILVELSADTVYKYSHDDQLVSLIVRNPTIQSMNPEVFLFPSLLTNRYYFIQTLKKESGFPSIDLLYDKQEKAIFRYTVVNDDYFVRETAYLKSQPVNNEIPSLQILEAHELVEAFAKGKLKGKLKEIAATLEEESNPVLMLIKHKK